MQLRHSQPAPSALPLLLHGWTSAAHATAGSQCGPAKTQQTLGTVQGLHGLCVDHPGAWATAALRCGPHHAVATTASCCAAQHVNQQLCWVKPGLRESLQLRYHPCLLLHTRLQHTKHFSAQAAAHTCCAMQQCAHVRAAQPFKQETLTVAVITSGNEERGDFQRSTCCPRATMRSSSDGLGSSCSTQPVSHMLYANSYGCCWPCQSTARGSWRLRLSMASSTCCSLLLCAVAGTAAALTCRRRGRSCTNRGGYRQVATTAASFSRDTGQGKWHMLYDCCTLSNRGGCSG